MSLPCKINLCKRKCCALCYCCNQNLCFNHLKEHRDLIHSQLNPLINEINTLNEQLTTLNIEVSNNWNVVLREDLTELRSTISDLICEQDTTNEDIILLTLTVYRIKHDIEIVKQKRIFNDFKLIPTEQWKVNTLSSPFHTIICKNPLGSALAYNNQRLLMDQRLSLHLFNQDLILEKKYQWKHGFIRNICWSSTLNKFIFTTNKSQVYLVNENLISIEHIQTIQEQDWYRCTCSDKSLFLTTNNRGTDIFQFNLSLSFELIQQWKSPHSCQDDELIHDMIYNNQTLALMIEDSLSNMVHMELRSSGTLDLLWLFRSDIECNLFQSATRCCSLQSDEWLLIDSNHSRLIHLNSNGKIKASHVYKVPPWNAILLSSNILAIRTENSLNFHKIY